MIPGPQRSASTPIVPRRHEVFDIEDDDEGWQDMPVVRSTDGAPVGFDDEDDPRKRKYLAPVRMDEPDKEGPANATGATLELDPDLATDHSWRDKKEQDESDYTRLRLFEDEESEEVHMRTKFLFDEEKAMTPLSQMQATKEMLTEGQRIAYVGLSALVAREMILDMGRGLAPAKKGQDEESGVVGSGRLWMLKIMARLYQHMNLNADEQRMIESLAEHGVMAADLVPALMTTHTVKNPEYDPTAARAIPEEDEPEQEQDDSLTESVLETAAQDFDNQDLGITEQENPPSHDKAGNEQPQSSCSDPFGQDDPTEIAPPPYEARTPRREKLSKNVNPFGDDEDSDGGDIAMLTSPPAKVRPLAAATQIMPDVEEGDIASTLEDIKISDSKALTAAQSEKKRESSALESTTVSGSQVESTKPTNAAEVVKQGVREEGPKQSEALPGVSTALSKTDQNVTLDIRWTVLCDMFLQLIGDSVYDARSRVFLERVAAKLGLTWLDVTRFEKRVTDALEIQEGVESQRHAEIIEGRAKSSKKRRIAMMGLATLGGGLVIGLSAGLLAPVIGAGLGAAFAGVGISGTGAFLGGAGGAALITSGGILSGGAIAGKGMNRRTKNVRTFEFRPIHNNKRVNCFITVPGYMATANDDVRLPFSTLDSIVGDVFSVHWEPEMMNELGNALKILTSEVLSSVGTSVLGTTMMMGGLMSGLSLPIVLTKLGYLIDNPWSNALDRAYAAGLVLADVLIQRHAGVRPISLIGFSLGARVIFYALDELAKRKAFGIVQDVYLFGATVTAPKATWLNARAAVAGRFVNAYATNDWVLGYLFRATSGGLSSVAGLRAIEMVPGLENIDVTDRIAGHMSYRPCMPSLLEVVGLPITADWFDEPDDPELDSSVQKRTVTNEQDENQQKTKSKLWGIFPRKQSSGSGHSTPKVTPPPSFPSTGGNAKMNDYEDDDGDLSKGGLSTPPVNAPSPQRLAVPGQPVTAPSSATSSTVDLPATAGFDFKKISDVLGKNVDPESVTLPQPSIVVPQGVREMQERAPLERAESAPPLNHTLEPASAGTSRPVSPAFPSAREQTTRANPASEISNPMNESSFSNEWSQPAAVTVSSNASSRAARGFPSHVLQSATNIFSQDLHTANAFEEHGDDDDDAGDIGGFGREPSPARTAWSTLPTERKPKDEWALNNPW